MARRRESILLATVFACTSSRRNLKKVGASHAHDRVEILPVMKGGQKQPVVPYCFILSVTKSLV